MPYLWLWGWHRAGTPLLWSLALVELTAKDSPSPRLLLPAPWEAVEGPPGPPPSTKAMGQGWKTISFSSSISEWAQSTPCNVSGIVLGLDQGSNPEPLALGVLARLSPGLCSSSPRP